jgi:GntR family transcriptional regulator, sialic acid-inducible nan operon repressor
LNKNTDLGQFTLVEPVRRRKLYQEVYDRLEAMIASGELSPGDVLPSERELSDLFRVGRVSVREAMFSLQKAGLVVIRNGERPYVTRPSADALIGEMSSAVKLMMAADEGARKLQQARAMLETSLARFAARHAGATDLARLEKALEANRMAIGDTAEFTRTDVAFHLVIAEIPQNSIFTSLHFAFLGWLAGQRTTSLKAEGATQAAYEAHQSIFRALVAHDADAAESAMRSHLSTVEKYYWENRSRDDVAHIS